MINWREYPFVRLLLSLITGVLSSFVWTVVLPSYVFIFLSLPLIGFTYFRVNYKYRYLYGFFVALFFFLLGNFLGYHANESRRIDHYHHFLTEQTDMVAMVTNIKATAKSYRVELTVNGMNGVAKEQPVSGKLLGYLEQSKEASQLRYGDQIYFSGKVKPIAAPLNPAAFNLKGFLNNRNFHYQTYLKTSDWILQDRNQGNILIAFSIRQRDRLFDILQKHLPTDNELAVGAALILGKKDLLESDTRMAYANTGAMHVLAVSGLHVGLIYVGISFLLGLFPFKSSTWVWIKTWIMVAGVWFFALLTGASPSVLRAATMFSFIIVGQAMRHHPSIYNTLAASAFFLLCIQPYMLFEVGFQLSYLAVTGIIYFQEKIYGLLFINNKLGNYIWKLTSVAIAAQLVTLPISLYYFHQFPVYFWLSGLVVIPAAVLIMTFAVTLFVVMLMIPELGFIPGMILYGILYITNGLIFLISQLPGAIISGIWISPSGLILLYLIILAVVIAIERKQFRWLQISAILLLLFSLNFSYHRIKTGQKSELVFYHTNKNKTLIDAIDRSISWSLRSKNISDKDVDFLAKNYRIKSGVQEVQNFQKDELMRSPEFFYHDHLIQFKNIKIQIVDGYQMPQYIQPPVVDYILLENNTSVKLKTLAEYFKTKKFIVSANNSFWKIEQWKKEAVVDCELIDIKKEGAFILLVR